MKQEFKDKNSQIKRPLIVEIGFSCFIVKTIRAPKITGFKKSGR